MKMEELELRNISVKYGSALAVHRISIRVKKGQRVALLGSNGAGKTTVCRAVSGTQPLSEGEIWYRGHRIDLVPAHRRVQLGISLVPEGRLVFPKMTVWENLELGATQIRDRERKEQTYDLVFGLFPRLKERLNQQAGRMSGGEQQMLTVARALMARPKVLLCDEISMGLAPIVVKELYRTLLQIRESLGLTLLVVEQDAKLALGFADYCYVLENGRIAAEGTPEDLIGTDALRKVYLSAGHTQNQGRRGESE